MKIAIRVQDVTPAQWEWLLEHVDTVWPLETGGVPVCVQFEGAGGEILHREIGVRRWLEIIGELRGVTLLAEAALTPDSLPDIFAPYPYNSI